MGKEIDSSLSTKGKRDINQVNVIQIAMIPDFLYIVFYLTFIYTDFGRGSGWIDQVEEGRQGPPLQRQR